MGLFRFESEMNAKPTIFAVSSGAGRAGISVIRISGPAAAQTFKLFSVHQPKPRQVAVRRLRDGDGEILDEAVVLWLPGPGTATGEDTVEMHLHGSPAIVSAVLRGLGETEEFTHAAPGAFTRQAFENKRLDLLQVEGLADVLAAESPTQRRLAMRQLLGEASSIYEAWRADLLKSLALVEAAIDFSNEADVADKAQDAARRLVERLVATFDQVLADADRVSAIRRGLRVVLAGPPNAGKSSLLNWLVGRDVAIVSALAGTTRDVIEAPLVLEGVPLLLADTAGLNDRTQDAIEREGMRRSRDAISTADVFVWIEAVDGGGFEVPLREPDLHVLSKTDLVEKGEVQGFPAGRTTSASVLSLSVKSGDGLQQFRDALANLIRERNKFGEADVVVRERHRLSVAKALTHLRQALKHESNALEFMAEDMRKAAYELAGLSGRIGVEDVLGQIFEEFCIGK